MISCWRSWISELLNAGPELLVAGGSKGVVGGTVLAAGDACAVVGVGTAAVVALVGPVELSADSGTSMPIFLMAIRAVSTVK